MSRLPASPATETAADLQFLKDAQPLKLRTTQIGRCGELLVQYRLLRLGVESAAMTTDNGIDLVAYSPRDAKPKTIQVKTNLQAKPGGGKGKLAIDWWLPQSSPAQLVALVDLKADKVWLLTHGQMVELAQQQPVGRLHLYMYTDSGYVPRRNMCHVRDFDQFLLEARVKSLFGGD